MNIQPYGVPDQHWPPKLNRFWFHLAKYSRANALKKQRFVQIEVQGLDYLKAALQNRCGVLLAPNHSFHWDSYCLLEAANKLSTPFYFMTAWQVFAQSSWLDRMSMQRCGCFSVDREGTDLQSLKTAVDILHNRPEPLVIFPEGDVYHTNDRITPFRDGAAAMALMAARKADRPVVILPVAIKRWYLEDPTPSMLDTITSLETRLYWRPRIREHLLDRIFRVADGLLALKELEYLQVTDRGDLPDRIRRLADHVLCRCEQRYQVQQPARLLPERVKEVRRRIIQQQQACSPSNGDGMSTSADRLPHSANTPTNAPSSHEKAEPRATPEQMEQWSSDMHDMFFVTQLYSYPGDYLRQRPTWERVAETLDKLEEDALGATYPSVRGPRRALVRIDKPIELPREKDRAITPATLTDLMESRVQAMLDEMNAAINSPCV